MLGWGGGGEGDGDEGLYWVGWRTKWSRYGTYEDRRG